MPNTPTATEPSQSEWGTPTPSPCPKQDYCNSSTAHLPAAPTALSARDSTIPTGYAFAIMGRTNGRSRLAVGLLEMCPRARFRWSDTEESSPALRFLARIEPSWHLDPSANRSRIAACRLHVQTWPLGHGGLLESGYPSLSGPYLSDGSYIMEMGSTILHQPLLQARQRPVFDSVRQHQPPPQVAQVVMVRF